MRILLATTLVALVLAGCASPSGPTTGGSDGTGGHGGHSGHSSGHDMTGQDGHAGHAEGMAHVAIDDGAFHPMDIQATTQHGAHFTNDDDVRHQVTVFDPSANVVLDVVLEPGEDTHFQPAAAGDYHVWCRLHDMTAALHVA